jgi:hypothetical protein
MIEERDEQAAGPRGDAGGERGSTERSDHLASVDEMISRTIVG